MNQMTKFAGLDWSMSSPGLAIGDEKYVTFYGIRQKKKQTSTDANVILLEPNKVYSSDVERYYLLAKTYIDICLANGVTDIFMEGYAYGAVGNTFNIGECTGILKLELWKAGINLEILQPSEVKKFATGKGNANKTAMFDAYVEKTWHRMDKAVDDERVGDKIPSPVNDMIDSYFILMCGLSSLGVS